MAAYVRFEIREAFAESVMVVCRKRAGVYLEAERAQSAAKAGHFPEQLLRVSMGDERMVERREMGIDGMEEPVLGDVACRHSGLKHAAALLLFLGEHGAFFVEDVDEPPQHLSEPGAGVQAETWRNKRGIGFVAASAIAQ